jgi:hypothetical protein
VTNNNGFWIGWLDLLAASFTITRNHNQLQEVTINLQPNPSSLSDEDRPNLVLWLTPRKTRVMGQECDFIGSLPSNGCPSIVESLTLGICLPSRCLAMFICVTICLYSEFCVQVYEIYETKDARRSEALQGLPRVAPGLDVKKPLQAHEDATRKIFLRQFVKVDSWDLEKELVKPRTANSRILKGNHV